MKSKTSQWHTHTHTQNKQKQQSAKFYHACAKYWHILNKIQYPKLIKCTGSVVYVNQFNMPEHQILSFLFLHQYRREKVKYISNKKQTWYMYLSH